ncbi:MAG: amidohydrolase family protein [Pseudomonadales bacterium]|nr:amidohydrolase [Pseudomonadales bacterium]NIX09657.1 amidohydrolase family protein [Pseudomonadales bacterium]
MAVSRWMCAGRGATLGAVLLALASCSEPPAQSPAEEGAEPAASDASPTLYAARSVITMDPELPRAEAVAVADERIVAVGALAELRGRYPGASVDETFADHVVMAGLIDQHLHPFLAALTMTAEVVSIEEWVLPERTFPAARDPESYLALLGAAAAAMEDPAAPLISWGYHHYFHGSLTRKELDAISDSRPILVWHRSAHEFVLNTPALAAAGVTEEMVAAEDEVIREQINLADGHFWERGNFDFLVPRLMPVLAAPERFRAGLELTEAYLHASGVTLSAEPGGLAGVYDTYNAVLGDAGTPFRFYFIPDGRGDPKGSSDAELVAAVEASLAPITDRTGPLTGHVKLFADGAMFSQLMQMQDGYTDGHEGEWLMEPETFRRVFRAFWDAGYQIHVHQNGDAGLELVLDTLEANLARNPRDDHRTTIVHFGFSKAEQVERIAQLGAIVSANPYYTVALADRYSEIGIGPERANAMVRLGGVARAGVRFSLHSDMPMAPGSPLFLAWAAVNRVTPSGRVAGPDQRVSLQDALEAVTIDAAYSLRLEDEVGSITPGKLANFTVLEADPFAVEPMEIKDIGVWGTVFEGRLQPVVGR